MIEITTPVGRLVSGHPMHPNPKKNKDGSPKIGKDGVTQLIDFYSGLAIQKGAEIHWNQTDWGQKIWNEAKQAFPNGEYNAPTFAWKIDDGDSQIPNKKGKIPCQREGWAGHWILHVSNGFPFTCYYDGKWTPYESIQNKDEIKAGDYCQFVIEVKGNNVNGPNESPGVYLNPTLFNLIQAGVKIVSANETDPNNTFAASNRALPQGAMIDPNQAPAPGAQQQAPAPAAQQQAPAPGAQQQAPAPGAQQQAPAPGAQQQMPPQQQMPGTVSPAPDFVSIPVVKSYIYNGQVYTEQQLLDLKWSPDAIAKLPLFKEDDIPF